MSDPRDVELFLADVEEKARALVDAMPALDKLEEEAGYIGGHWIADCIANYGPGLVDAIQKVRRAGGDEIALSWLIEVAPDVA